MQSERLNFWNRLLLQVDSQSVHKIAPSIHLDLGGGRNPRNPFGASKLISTDFSEVASEIHQSIEYVSCDLTQSLPFPDDSIDSCSAFDLLEHIPRWERRGNIVQYPFIQLMSEIHRVLKPNGKFLAVTPAFPSAAAFQDPTHINFISEETISYFVGDHPHANSIGYGYSGRFDLIYQGWLRGAGPYQELSLLSSANLRSKSGITNYVKLLNRVIRLMRNRNPSHLVWLIQKQV